MKESNPKSSNLFPALKSNCTVHVSGSKEVGYYQNMLLLKAIPPRVIELGAYCFVLQSLMLLLFRNTELDVPVVSYYRARCFYCSVLQSQMLLFFGITELDAPVVSYYRASCSYCIVLQSCCSCFVLQSQMLWLFCFVLQSWMLLLFHIFLQII